ncbi:MAG: oxidoreductase [Planctomycetes bacterium]|nr:oxidoreductase [Planctomycetota bacterium]HJM57927.1 Gfo/Idh/MocA family oxidoreductase [Planctomycetota bacterium]
MTTAPLSRRSALKLGSAFAAPLILPGGLRTLAGSNEAIRIGCIGTGRMGRGDMFALLDRGLDPTVNARIVAVCDPDLQRAEHAKRDVEERYAKKLPEGPASTIDVYADFRDLLARPDIDAVSISTPDFWHAGHGVAAAKAKKDIYIQKPITLTIGEGQALVKAVRENGVILQTGSQQRSSKNFWQACELVRNGRIGKLQRVEVWLPPDHGRATVTDVRVPEHFDYDLWMGPSTERPYAELGVHPQKGYGRPGWLQRHGYTRGMITGWGAHMNDIAQWGHGGDTDSGLTEIEAQAFFPDRGLFDVHTSYFARGKWADGVPLIQRTDPQAGVTFTGSDGWLFVKRGGITAGPSSILQETVGDDEDKLYVSGDHYRNFLECVRSREDPICPVEVGHRSNSLCVITHISMLLQRKLKWDPASETFPGDDEANAMLDFERRAGWEL